MKLRTKILGGLIAVAGLAVLVLIVDSGSNKRAVEAYKNQLRALGERLTVAELVPLPSVDSAEVTRVFMSTMSLAHAISNYPSTMKTIGPGCALVAWQQDILPDTDNKLSNIWPNVSLELQADRDTLSNLQSVFDAPVLFFNLDYSQGWAIMLPHLAKLRQAEILESMSAMAALHEGKFSQSWTNLLAAVALVRRYQAEPIVISHLVRTAIAQIAIGTTWEFLQSDRWSEPQLAGLQSEWQEIEMFNVPEPAFVMERALNEEYFPLMRKSYEEIAKLLGGGSTAGSPGFFSRLADDPVEAVKDLYNRYPRYWAWKRSWSYEEELILLQHCDATLRSIHRTELSGAFVPALKELDANIDRIDKQHPNAAAHAMFGGLGGEMWHNSLLKFADAEIGRRLLVTAIALKRYQLREGKYPASLTALMPDLLRQVPIDLMDGQPLRYQLKPDGNFLLYSVGEDGEDNGGDPSANADGKSKGWLKERDVVWPRAATAAEVAAYYKTNLNMTAQNILPVVRSRPKETNGPVGTNGAGR